MHNYINTTKGRWRSNGRKFLEDKCNELALNSEDKEDRDRVLKTLTTAEKLEFLNETFKFKDGEEATRSDKEWAKALAQDWMNFGVPARVCCSVLDE